MQITFTEQDFKKDTKSCKVLKMILDVMGGEEPDKRKEPALTEEDPRVEAWETVPQSESDKKKKDEESYPEPVQEVQAPEIALEEARAELAKYAKKRSPKEAKELLKSLGADKLTDLPANCYSKLLAAIKEG